MGVALIVAVLSAASPRAAAATGEEEAVSAVLGEPVAPLATAPPAAAPWIRRHRPSRHMVELGVTLGSLFPPLRHGLVDDAILAASGGTFFQRFDAVAAAPGASAAYFPSPRLGIEAGAFFAPTYTSPLRERADVFGVDGRVIAQLARWSATPYLAVGGGLLGTRGALGRDVDPAATLAIGGRFHVTRRLVLRVEVRDTLAEGVDRPLAHYVAASFGVSLTIRPRRGAEASR